MVTKKKKKKGGGVPNYCAKAGSRSLSSRSAWYTEYASGQPNHRKTLSQKKSGKKKKREAPSAPQRLPHGIPLTMREQNAADAQRLQTAASFLASAEHKNAWEQSLVSQEPDCALTASEF